MENNKIFENTIGDFINASDLNSNDDFGKETKLDKAFNKALKKNNQKKKEDSSQKKNETISKKSTTSNKQNKGIDGLDKADFIFKNIDIASDILGEPGDKRVVKLTSRILYNIVAKCIKIENRLKSINSNVYNNDRLKAVNELIKKTIDEDRNDANNIAAFIKSNGKDEEYKENILNKFQEERLIDVVYKLYDKYFSDDDDDDEPTFKSSTAIKFLLDYTLMEKIVSNVISKGKVRDEEFNKMVDYLVDTANIIFDPNTVNTSTEDLLDKITTELGKKALRFQDAKDNFKAFINKDYGKEYYTNVYDDEKTKKDKADVIVANYKKFTQSGGAEAVPDLPDFSFEDPNGVVIDMNNVWDDLLNPDMFGSNISANKSVMQVGVTSRVDPRTEKDFKKSDSTVANKSSENKNLLQTGEINNYFNKADSKLAAFLSMDGLVGDMYTSKSVFESSVKKVPSIFDFIPEVKE